MENLYQYINLHAENIPNKSAIVFKDNEITYRQLDSFTSKVRCWVKDKDIKEGQIGFIFLPQTPSAILWFFGLMSAGIIPSFMPLPSAKQDDKKYWDSHKQLLKLTNPSVIITTEEWLDEFNLASEGINCEVYNEYILSSYVQTTETQSTLSDIAFLQHSSGTTGLKKGVALTHKAVINQIESYSKAIESTSEDVVVSWLPMYHDMGLIACTIMPLIMGQTIVLLDPFEWVGKPITLFQAITRYKGTLVWLPNFSFDHLRRTISSRKFEGLNVSSIRAFINCSEPCKAVTFDRFTEHFDSIGVTDEQLQVCYAMAETVYAATQTILYNKVNRLWVDDKELLNNVVKITSDGVGTELLSCGKALKGCDITILNPNSNEAVGDAQIGEVVISGEFLFDGYYNRPNKTQDVYDGTTYRTRDLGFIHNNELYVLGRKDDLIICNGRNYFAHEIEKIINQLPQIKPGRNVALGIYNEQIGSNEIYLVQERSSNDSISIELDKQLIKLIRQAVFEEMGLMLRDVIIVNPAWLHKSSSGKISRNLNKIKLLKFLRGSSD